MRLSNSELKHLRSLTQKKVRQNEKKFLLEGWRALKEFLNSSVEADLVAVLPSYFEDPDYRKMLDAVRERKIPVKEITEKELRSVSETVHAQGVVAVIHQRSTPLSPSVLDQARMVVAADAISDPGNLGSIIRTADWFGVDLVVLGKGCVELYNDKVVRTTVGSLFHVRIANDVDLAAAAVQFKNAGFRLLALSAEGRVSYHTLNWNAKTVMVVGNEAHGVSKDVRGVVDEVVKIPREGRAESLNVGVACGIVLAHRMVSGQGGKRTSTIKH
ncbi:MAG: RNA methyltransferase [Bacteroidia bacterium]|nr:MAG: RNA methyltransferase [Bacteroidia bacterium]